jgi:hypothetical protein
MTSAPRARLAETLLLTAVALAATYPVFIDTYRSMVFQTVPRDDYAPYLLHLVGHGGEVPGAPRAYRFLSVAAAIPAYLVLPVYRFKNLAEVDPAYLRATEALAFVSWIALAALSVIVYRIARDRLGASRPASVAALFATLVFARYTSLLGVDAIALLLIAAAYYWIDRPWLFAAIVALSAGFNEKVWIVAVLLVGTRVLHVRSLRPYVVHVAGCAVAILLYFGAATYFRTSGTEKPSDPRPLGTQAPFTVRMTMTAKGLAQNAMPVGLCLAACALAALRLRGERGPYWTPWDALVPLGLAVTGLTMNVEYTLGRLVFHSLPILVPPLALALDRTSAQTVAPDVRTA